MSLDFLDPAAGVTASAARSPILDVALAGNSAATVAERGGWKVVASFGDPPAEARARAETVAFADLSQLAKVEVSQAETSRLPSGIAERAVGHWLCPVRPDLQLFVSTGEGRPSLPVSARDHAVDLTGSLAAIAIAGPAARETIARFCALDTRERSLPVAGFMPGSIARTPGYLLREGDDRFLLLFGAAYGIYLWEVVADAAERLGGRPAGIDCIPPLDEERRPDA